MIRKLLDDLALKGILANITADQYNPKGLSQKRGGKTTTHLLQELGESLLNEGKLRALNLTPHISQ